MFEVGKLSDESLDSFLAELEKVRFQGSAISYFKWTSSSIPNYVFMLKYWIYNTNLIWDTYYSHLPVLDLLLGGFWSRGWGQAVLCTCSDSERHCPIPEIQQRTQHGHREWQWTGCGPDSVWEPVRSRCCNQSQGAEPELQV